VFMCRIFVFRGFARAGFLTGICFITALMCQAQQAAGTVRLAGQVVDQQGGVLPGATVILLNSAGAVRLQQTSTSQDGGFAFAGLAPGDYVVEAQRTGFNQGEKKITLTAAQPESSVSISMTVAGPGQQLTVSAELDSFKTDG